MLRQQRSKQSAEEAFRPNVDQVVVDSMVKPLNMLAYRSRAAVSPTQAELDRILRSAQRRNHDESVTGLLIYDQGCFFQWLEGPAAGLGRVWDSICRDPRHHSIEVLREESMPNRFFGSWDMRLAQRARGKIDAALAVVETPEDLLRRLHGRPAVLAHDAWDDVFADVVIPRLRVAHPRSTPGISVGGVTVRRPAAAGTIWHAPGGAGAELGGILLAVDAGKTVRYIDALLDQGAGIDALYNEVFEPAARWLGGRWDDDLCNDFNVTLGLGRLQLEVRRLGNILGSHDPRALPGHAVLVAPQPGEPHGLGAAMSSELFGREGWDVSCEFPGSDDVLVGLVHDHWFDVLDLSLSGALRRDHRLQDMGVTIRAAQAASLNPALTVIVGGRSFIDSPKAYLDVGADIGCTSSVDVVSTAQRLLDTMTPWPHPVHRVASSLPVNATPRQAAVSLSLFGRRFKSTVF